MSTQTIQWIQPTIESQTISANVMKMAVNFNDGTMSKDITITRVGNEFYAEEVGFYCRKFVDAEVLRWEFEYHESLVPQLNAMPSGNVAPKTYMNFDKMDAATAGNPLYDAQHAQDVTKMSPAEIMLMLDKMMGTNQFTTAPSFGNTYKPTSAGSNMTPKKKKRKKRR